MLPIGDSLLADEVVDFEASAAIPDLELKVAKGERITGTKAVRHSGLCVAMFYLYSASYADNLRRAAQVRRAIVRNHELLPA